MTDLSVNYMGLDLRNPLIASSSPLTATAAHIEELVRNGIGAAVLKSIFEEQISGEAAMMARYGNDYPEAADYLHAYLGADYMQSFIDLISEVKRSTDIPVIASINCMGKGKWVEYAGQIAAAGADGLELNIFFMPDNETQVSAEIEARYLGIIEAVTRTVDIPVSVKFSRRFTNIFHMMQASYNRGAKGAVLYNRFFEPDIDIENMEYISASGLSTPAELHKSLRDVAIATAEMPGLDISVSTGVHSGEDAVKALLVGARAVQLCSTLLINGVEVIGRINAFLAEWMGRNGFATVDDFRGLMNRKERRGDLLLERVQYMKTFPSEF